MKLSEYGFITFCAFVGMTSIFNSRYVKAESPLLEQAVESSYESFAEGSLKRAALTWFLASQEITAEQRPLMINLTTNNRSNSGYLGFLRTLVSLVEQYMPQAEINIIVQQSKVDSDTPGTLSRFGLSGHPIYLLDDYSLTCKLTAPGSIPSEGLPEADLTISIAHYAPCKQLSSVKNRFNIGWLSKKSELVSPSSLSNIATSFRSGSLFFDLGLTENTLGILHDPDLLDRKTSHHDRFNFFSTEALQQQLRELYDQHPWFVDGLLNLQENTTPANRLWNTQPFFYTYFHEVEPLIEFAALVSKARPDLAYIPFIVNDAYHGSQYNERQTAEFLRHQNLSVEFISQDKSTSYHSEFTRRVVLVKKPFLHAGELRALQLLSEPLWGITSHNSLMDAITLEKLPFFSPHIFTRGNFFLDGINQKLKELMASKIARDFFADPEVFGMDFTQEGEPVSVSIPDRTDFMRRVNAITPYENVLTAGTELNSAVASANPLIEAMISLSRIIHEQGDSLCAGGLDIMEPGSMRDICLARGIYQAIREERELVLEPDYIMELVEDLTDPYLREALGKIVKARN
ncbi:MAG: hypothetical protein ACR2PT_19910 [Endozoicomonas sp.]